MLAVNLGTRGVAEAIELIDTPTCRTVRPARSNAWPTARRPLCGEDVVPRQRDGRRLATRALDRCRVRPTRKPDCESYASRRLLGRTRGAVVRMPRCPHSETGSARFSDSPTTTSTTSPATHTTRKRPATAPASLGRESEWTGSSKASQPSSHEIKAERRSEKTVKLSIRRMERVVHEA